MQIHNHNPEQQQALSQLLNDVIQKLLGIRFGDPETDQRSMLHHAALTGKYELLLQLLQDDYPMPEPIQPNHE